MSQPQRLSVLDRTFLDFEVVAATLVDKLVRRHPHVFGDAEVKDAEAQTHLWEELKAAERANRIVITLRRAAGSRCSGAGRTISAPKRSARISPVSAGSMSLGKSGATAK